MDGLPSGDLSGSAYDTTHYGIDNPGFDSTHRSHSEEAAQRNRGRPSGTGFDPYLESSSNPSFDHQTSGLPPPPPPPQFPHHSNNPVFPSSQQQHPERQPHQQPTQPLFRLDLDQKRNPLYLETSDFSTDPLPDDDGDDCADVVRQKFPLPPNYPASTINSNPLSYASDAPSSQPLRRANLQNNHPLASEKNSIADEALGAASLRRPPSISIIGAEGPFDEDRFPQANRLYDYEYDQRSSYNFSTPSVSLPSLGKGSLSNPIVVAVSTRNAVDASEMHPFEFWGWTKIRRGFAALFFAAFVALIAATIAIIVMETGGCENTLKWWQGTTFYEINVLSFKDGKRSDGRGDFVGISHELSSIKNLGVNTIRLNSIFNRVSEEEAEPIIIDYSGIHERFGSFEDLKSLVDDVHKEGLKIVLDFPVFTSQNHDWFLKSKNPFLSLPLRQKYGDYYLWSNVKDGSDGEDWIMDSYRGKSFFRHHEPNDQPYLNLASESLRSELITIFRLWRSSGIDGIVWRGLGKLAHHFHDFNVEKWMLTLDILKRVFNGQEIGSEDPEDDSELPSSKAVEGRIFAVEKEFYDEFLKEKKFLPEKLQHSDYFELLLQKISFSTNSTEELANQISQVQSKALDTSYPYTLWSLSGEESSRSASIYQEAFRSALIVLFSLPGSINIRYGDEVELHDVHVSEGTHHLGMGIMQWTSGRNGGFSSVTPWLPVNKDHQNAKWNVQDAAKNENSTLNLVKTMAELKNSNMALRATSYVQKDSDLGVVLRNKTAIVVANEGNFFVVVKTFPRQNSFLLIMNTGEEEESMDLSAMTWMGHLVACTEGYHVTGSGGGRGDIIALNSIHLHPKELEFIKLPKSLVIDDVVLKEIRTKNNITSTNE